ncbi:fatty acid desaturase family protein [Streptomyces sp. NBC_01803]|uniref:fatty acid desaturase family protein n=1 Tax=Streptomyces sp. NBC_01803 TaxID=2975946 RepID=UPI002DD9C90C|nr:acyl-CoA desaturase [Streptomyces sp. NBC_01803]WSA42915.1 acyl-CoA desaturase [Streptomyces sp. NBC_01803]
MPSAATAPAAPPRPPTGPGDEFAPLLRQVKGQDLLARRTGWYAAGLTVNALVLAALALAVLVVGDSWWTVALAAPLALFSTRTAFFGHDAGHAQIAATRRTNRLIGLAHGNLLLGMSSAWWNDKHNRHHANPNHLDKDPDVGEGVMVWTQAQAAKRAGLARLLTRHQAWLFFPLLLLEGFALKVASARMVLSPSGWERNGRARLVEGLLIAAHFSGYALLLGTAMSPGKAVVFALVHHALFGLHLGSVFAPNHKGMEMPDAAGTRWGHLRRQVLTSRNVRGGPVTDWLMGGLNYQIEHHLFPSMPRPHLRLARPLVRQYLREAGLPYTETGLVDSYRQALRHMHEVGAPLRKPVGAGAGVSPPRS